MAIEAGGKSGISPITHFDASEFDCRIAGSIHSYNPLDHFSTKEARNMARFVQFACVASNEAIKNAVAEKFQNDHMEKLMADVIQSAMAEMKPQMLTMFRKVAQEMTLDIAEDMVKKTIDQIKNEG